MSDEIEDFEKWNGPFEGPRVPFMYLDSIGLVTIGTGNLIDPVSEALVLPFVRGSRLASQAEIGAVWHLVKSRQDLAVHGGMIFGSLPGNDLRLGPDAMTALFRRRYLTHRAALRARFPDYDTWPTEARWAMHSMAWALGPAWREDKWPRFTAAVRAQDWATCAEQCRIRTIPDSNGRNQANRRLFRCAAGLQPDV